MTLPLLTSVRSIQGRQVEHSFDLLRELVGRDLKLRYKRSLLGLFWSLVTPLSQLVVFTFLSRSVLRLDIPNYPLFVFSGVLAWTWFQSSLFLAADAITGNRVLIRRPGFPAALLPVVTVTTNLIHYLIALPALMLFMVLANVSFTPAMLALPLIMVIQFVLTLSIAYIIATLQVTMRDTQHMLSVVLMLLFYVTPVFYDARQVPAQYGLIYQLNPVAHLIEANRTVLIQGRWPDMLALGAVGILALALLTVGYRLFQSASDRFVEEL